MKNLNENSLLENAHAFINESLRNARRAQRSHQSWSFAVIHLIQGLELMLKAALEVEHSSLIYDNIEKPDKTVSIDQAINRLKIYSKIHFDEKELRHIKSASKIRNAIIHHKFEFNPHMFSNTYSRIFEYVHIFHTKHLKTDLHDSIDPMLHKFEALLLSKFSSPMVYYHGQEVAKITPQEIQYFQKFNAIRSNQGIVFRRIRQGEHTSGFGTNKACGDCGVAIGQFHTDACDQEQCPVCGMQFWGCEDIDAYLPISESEFRSLPEPPGIEIGKEVFKALIEENEKHGNE